MLLLCVLPAGSFAAALLVLFPVTRSSGCLLAASPLMCRLLGAGESQADVLAHDLSRLLSSAQTLCLCLVCGPSRPMYGIRRWLDQRPSVLQFAENTPPQVLESITSLDQGRGFLLVPRLHWQLEQLSS